MEQKVTFPATPGRQLSAKLLHFDSLAEVQASSQTEEVVSSLYQATFEEVPSGKYRIVAIDDTDIAAASFEVELLLAGGVFAAREVGFSDVVPVIVDRIWSEDQAGHVTVGTFGYHLDSRVSQVQGGGSNGDASEEKQNQIIALLSAAAVSNNPVVNHETMEVVNGDTYDGSPLLNPKASWVTSVDYQTADSISLVFTDGNSIVLVEANAESESLVTASFMADFDYLSFSGCPLNAQVGYALVATTDGKDKTIARGTCYVYERGDPA